MAGESVKYTVAADSAKALAEMKKVVDLQGKTIQKLQETGRESRKTGEEGSKAWGGMLKVGTQIAGVLGIGGGIASGLTGAIKLTKDWYAGMQSVGRAISEASDELVAFSMMQQGGTARAAVLDAQALGAQYGVKRGAALNTIQALQAQLGGLPQGRLAARSVFELSGWGGVPMDRAKMATVAGVGAGMTAEQTAQWLYAAGEASALSPAELAAVGPALPFYQTAKGGPGMGFAFGAALSGTYPEQLPTYTRAAGRALSTPAGEGKWGKYVSRLPGYGEGDYMQMLRAMHAGGVTSTQDIAKLGLSEIRQSGALAALLGNLPGAEAAITKTQELAGIPGLVGLRRAGAETGFPELAFGRKMDIIEAALAAERGTPSTPQAAAVGAAGMASISRRKARALAMQLYGAGGGLDEGQDEVGVWEWNVTMPLMYPATGLIGYNVDSRGRMERDPGVPTMAEAAGMIEAAGPNEIPAVLRDIRDTLARIEQNRTVGAPNRPEAVTR